MPRPARRANSEPSTRNRSTRSSRPWCAPDSGRPPSWPRWRSRRPDSASSRTRSSRTYVATEFLHDYLRDKKSVGDHRRGRREQHPLRRRADRGGAGDHPGDQPDVDGAVQGDRAPPRRATPCCSGHRRTRCALRRSVEILREAAEAAGMPAGALQVIPDAAHEVTHYLFKHPKVDFVWVTGGPQDRRARQRGREAGLSASVRATRRSTSTRRPTSRAPSSTC